MWGVLSGDEVTGRRATKRASVSLLLANLLLATAVQATPPEAGGASGDANGAASAPTAPPTVDLERLLRLPRSYDAGGGRYGGATSRDWRTRFAETRNAVVTSQRELARAQDELEETAADSSQWQMGAPGLGKADPEHASVSLKLRAQIRTLRDKVAAADRQQRELVIEADLAGVPESWRGPEVKARSDRRE